MNSESGLSIGGGYRFNPHLAVEGGLVLMTDIFRGSSSIEFAPYTDETLTPTSEQAAMVGILPLEGGKNLFGKLGFATTTLDYSYSLYGGSAPPVTGSGSTTKTNPLFGFGWQSAPSMGWRLLLQYQNLGTVKLTPAYSNGRSNTYDVGIHVVSVGGMFSF